MIRITLDGRVRRPACTAPKKSFMRITITITIDDDVLAAANALARLNSESLGQVLSRLARAALALQRPLLTSDDEPFPLFRVGENSPPLPSKT